MAEVNIEREPDKGGSATWAWVLVVVLLIGLIAWFMFGRGGADDAGDINVDVSAPATAPAPATGSPPPATP